MLYNDRPFRFWCHRILPLVYDESLSYYELLCKVVAYLNHMLEDVTQLTNDVEELTNLYHELKEYVDNYFDNLDLQDEVNHKLDEMVEDGTLDRLLGAYVKNYTKMLLCVSTYRDSVKTDSQDYCLAVSTDGGKTFTELMDSYAFGNGYLGSDCSIYDTGNGYAFLATGANPNVGNDFNMIYTKDFVDFTYSRPTFGFLALAQTMCEDAYPMVGTPQIVEDNGKRYLMLSVPTATSYSWTNMYGMTDTHRTLGLYACEIEFDFSNGFAINKVGDIFRINVADHSNVMDGDIKKLGDYLYLAFKDREDLTVHIAKATSITGEFEDVINCCFETPYTEAAYFTKLNDTEALLYCTCYYHGSTSDQVTQFFGYFNSVTEKLIYLGEPVRSNCHHFYSRGNAIDCGMRNPYPIVVSSDLYLLLKERYNIPTNLPTITDDMIPFKYTGSPSNTMPQRASKYLYDTYGVYTRLLPWVYYYISNTDDPLYIGTDGEFLCGQGANLTFNFPNGAVRTIVTDDTSERFRIIKNSITPCGTTFNQYHESLGNGIGMYVMVSVYGATIGFRGLTTAAIEDGDVIGQKPDIISNSFYWFMLPVFSRDGVFLGTIDVRSTGDIIYKGTDIDVGEYIYTTSTQAAR